MLSFKQLLEIGTNIKVLHLKQHETGDFNKACPMTTEVGEGFTLTSVSFRSGPVALQHPHMGKG